MVTKAKPKHSKSMDLQSAVQSATSAVDKALGDQDYKDIMELVPLRPGASLQRLQSGIRTACVSVVIQSELARDAAKPAEIKAKLLDLAEHVEKAFSVLNELDPTLRILLAEERADEIADEEALAEVYEPIIEPEEEIFQESEEEIFRPAIPFPIEPQVLNELELLSRLARKKAKRFDTAGRKRRDNAWLAVLMEAWSDATGRSPYTATSDGDFLTFAGELIRLLQERGFDVDNPSRRQMDNAQAYFKRDKKRSY